MTPVLPAFAGCACACTAPPAVPVKEKSCIPTLASEGPCHPCLYRRALPGACRHVPEV